ncbi:MAG: APC family permease [Actinomycetota bacterium]
MGTSEGTGSVKVPEGREVRLAYRSIGFWEALAMSVAAMGPLLGALGVAPLIASQAGFSAPFIFVITWVAMFIVAVTIARFSRVLPSAASIYTYISKSLGERTGFLSAWLSYMYYFAFEPLLLLGFGLFAEAGFDFVFGVSIPWWIWVIIGWGIVLGLSVLGIKLSMRIDLILAVITDITLFVVSIAVIVTVIGNGDFTLSPLSPTHAPTDFTGLSLAIAFGVLIFLGFEQSFTLSEEVRDPHGHVPKAIFAALAMVGVVLFTATFAMTIGFGQAGQGALQEAFAAEGTPWWELIRIHLSPGWRTALHLVAPVSILANTIASHNAVVRIEYGMGRAGALPRTLGWTHRRYRTPIVAIGVQSGLSLAVTLIAGLVWDPATAFGFLGFMIGLAAAVAFILIMAAALRYFHRERRAAGAVRNYVVPGLGMLILIPVVYTSFYPNPGYPLNVAPWLIVGWVVLGALYLWWRESRREIIDLDYAFRELGEPVPAAAPDTEP